MLAVVGGVGSVGCRAVECQLGRLLVLGLVASALGKLVCWGGGCPGGGWEWESKPLSGGGVWGFAWGVGSGRPGPPFTVDCSPQHNCCKLEALRVQLVVL